MTTILKDPQINTDPNSELCLKIKNSYEFDGMAPSKRIVSVKKSVLRPFFTLLKQLLLLYAVLFFITKPISKILLSSIADEVELYEIESEKETKEVFDEEVKWLVHPDSISELNGINLSKLFTLSNFYTGFVSDILIPPPDRLIL